MKEIVNRLHESRQVQLAKEILESNGYKVGKKLNDSDIVSEEYRDSVEEFFEYLSKAFEILKNTEEGVLESIVRDKLLYDRVQEYMYNLDNALMKSKAE